MANIIRPPLTGDPAQDSWNNQVSILLNSGVIGGSQTGTNTNAPGRNGVNSATITLYQRTETNLQPTVLPDQSTYTYETSTLTPNGDGSLNDWSQTFDDGVGLYLWSIIRYASGTVGTETVNSGDWSTPSLISSPGSSTGFRIDTSYAEELGQTTEEATKEIQAFTFVGPLNGEIPAVIGADGIAEVQDVALTGTLAGPVEEVIGVDAVAEIQDITVAGTLAAAVEGVIGVDAVAEVQDVAVAGTLAGVVAAVAEIDSVGWSGTRSNVFVAANNEIITVSLIDDFNSGVTQSDTQLDLETESNSVLHEIGNTYSWPTGDLGDASLPTGWDYIPGLGSGTSPAAIVGQIVNNTGEAVSLNNASVSMTINVTALPADGTTQPGFFVQQGFSFIFVASRIINAIGSYTFTDNTVQNPISLADGEALSLFMFESTTADQGFTYTVTDVQLNTGVTLNTTYDLDVDTSDTVFVGNVTNSFGNDEDATAGVGQIGTDVTTMFPTITAGSVYSQNLPQVGATTTNATRDTDGFIPFLSWDVRDTAGAAGLSVNYTTWNDWVGNFFAFSALSSTFSDLTALIISEGIFSNVVLTITDNSNSSITATFNIDTITDISTDYFSLVSIVSQIGVPGTADVSWDLSLTGDVGFKSIDLNTNQIIDVAQSITTTANSGRNIVADVTASDGNASSGQASTYTVLDYSGTEVTAFTSFVSNNTETDLAAVLNTITTAINSNIEVPIDFMAVQNATLNRFDLTAVTGGAITGAWSITVNHHAQAVDAGDIAFGNTVVQTAGADEIAAEQSVVTFTSPQSEVSNTITTLGPKTAAEIATDLNTFLMVSGWTVALADTVTLRFTADVAEAVSGLFSSVDTNSHVTTTTTVSTEGVDFVEAVAPVDAETAEITITSPQGSASNTRTLTGPQTTAEIVTDLAANLIVSGWGVSENAGLLRLTADVAEAVDGSFVYADTQPHTSGVVATVVEGVDGVAPVSPADAQTMSLIFTSPDSVASTALALTGPQTQGAIIQYVIDNLVVVGWTVSLSGSDVRLTADVVGAVEGEFTAVDSENNVSSVVSVITEGADEVLPADAIPAQVTDVTFTTPQLDESSTITLTGPLTNAEINTELAATTVDNWTVSEVEGAVSFEAIEAGDIPSSFTVTESQSLLTFTLVVTDGSDRTVVGGIYRFPTGRVIDDDYVPLTIQGADLYAGTRSIYWTENAEPEVSTNPALYDYLSLTGADVVRAGFTVSTFSFAANADGSVPPDTLSAFTSDIEVSLGLTRYTVSSDDPLPDDTFSIGTPVVTPAGADITVDSTSTPGTITISDTGSTDSGFVDPSGPDNLTITVPLTVAGETQIFNRSVFITKDAQSLAQFVRVSSNTGTVAFNTGGTVSRTGNIVIRAVFVGIDEGDITWEASIGSDGTFGEFSGSGITYQQEDGTTPSTGLDNRFQVTITPLAYSVLLGSAESITFRATREGFFDQLTIARLDEGSDAIQVSHSNQLAVIEADYTGTIISGQTVTNTLEVKRNTVVYTYDDTSPFEDSTYRIANVIEGNASVSQANGTFTITDITSDSQVVTFDVIVTDSFGESTFPQSFTVIRQTVARLFPEVTFTPNVLIFDTDYLGIVTSDPQVVTVGVATPTGNAYTYDATDAGTANTFFITGLTDDGAIVANNLDGTLTFSGLSGNSANTTVNVRYYDEIAEEYNIQGQIQVTKNIVEREFPEVTIFPETVTLNANYLGEVTPVTETITIAVTLDGTALTYDSTDAGTDNTFVITSITDGQASLTLNNDGTATLTDLADDAESENVVFNVRYYDNIGQVYNVQRTLAVIKATAPRLFPEVTISPETVTLNANYLGEVTPVSETITIAVTLDGTALTYDSTDAGTDNTFVITSITDGQASLTLNNDGTATLTDLADDAESENVVFNVRYYDDIGQVYNVQRTLAVIKATAPRLFPEVTISPETITLNANYLGEVTPVSETITIAVTLDGTALTYDSTDAGTDNTFVITSITDGQASLTLNNDGTATLTDLADDAESENVVFNVRYYDDIGQVYNVQRTLAVIKASTPRPVPEVTFTPNNLVFNANYLGVVEVSSQVVTVGITAPDGTAFTYDSTDAGTANTFFITGLTDDGAVVSNNLDGTLTFTGLSGESANTTVNVRYYDEEVEEYNIQGQIIVTKNRATRILPEVLIDPETVTLDANYLGEVTPVSETITVSVTLDGTALTYDSTDAGTNNTFVITSITDGQASLTLNNDGTATLTDLADDANSENVVFNVRYYDNIGQVYNVQKTLAVIKATAPRPVPEVTFTPNNLVFNANYLGVVEVSSQVVTVGVTAPDGTAFTYDSTDAGTANTFFITGVTDGGAVVTNNLDGTLTFTGLSGESANTTVNVRYYDEEVEEYNIQGQIIVTKNRATRILPDVTIDPETVTLNANYLGEVTPVSETITVSVTLDGTALTYDSTDAGTNNTFVITSITDGQASVTLNNDGTATLTDLADDANSEDVVFNVRYYDNIGQVYNIQRILTVIKATAPRPVPEVTFTPNNLVFNADYLGVVEVSSQVVTVGVTAPDGTAFTYDSTDAGTANTFFITGVTDGGAVVTNNLDGTLTFTGLSGDSANTTVNVRYYDSELEEYNIQGQIIVVKNRATRILPEVLIDPEAVVLNANYLGEVTPVTETITVSVTLDGTALTYDSTDAGTNNTFVITSITDGQASVTLNNDGTATLTDLADDANSENVVFNIRYYDNIGQVYNIQRVLVVIKATEPRPVPEVTFTPNNLVFNANYLGVVEVSSQVVTVGITAPDGTAFTYDSTDAGTANTFFITGVTDDGAVVTNNLDGTLTFTGLSGDSANTTVNVRYYDAEVEDYNIQGQIIVTKNRATRILPEVLIDPETVTLNANYLGQVTPVTETITVSVTLDGTALTYDSTDAGTNNTFVITSITDGQASVTLNTDGTATLTDLADDANSEDVVFNVRYYDNIGQVYNIQQVLVVIKATAPRLFPEVTFTPNNLIFNANYLGVVEVSSQVVTVGVATPSGTAYTYDSTDAGTANTFFITGVTDGGAVVTNNLDGTLTFTGLSGDSANTTVNVRYYDEIAEDYNIQGQVIVTKNRATRILPEVLIDPEAVVLNANYLGEVTPVSETITVSVTLDGTALTYDSTDAGTNNTFVITSITDGQASLTLNNDGTATLTDLADDANSENVVFNVRYYDDIGQVYNVQKTLLVSKNVVAREVPLVTITPSELAFIANYLGTVTSAAQTVTVAVEGVDGTAFTYDSTDAGTANTFFITGVTDGGAVVTNNLDGTLTFTGLSGNSASTVVNIRYYDAEVIEYNTQGVIRVSKVVATQVVPTFSSTANLVLLTANYLGVVNSGQERVVTFSSPGYTYALTGNNTFTLSVSADGGATVVNNADGTISISNLPNNQDIAEVEITITYRDDIGQQYTLVSNVNVEKATEVRIAPGVFADTTQVTLTASSLGVVDPGQSETITFTVDGFTYDSEGEIGNDGFRISISSDGGASVTNNDDGSISITNLPTNQDTATVVVNLEYRDAAAMLYSQTVNIGVTKLSEAPKSFSQIMNYTFGTDNTPDTNGEAAVEGLLAHFHNNDADGFIRRQDFLSLGVGDILQIGNILRAVVSVDASQTNYVSVVVSASYDTISGDQNVSITRALTGPEGPAGYNGRVAIAGSPSFPQNTDGTWPTTDTCIATVSFTNGVISDFETFTVSVNSSGVPIGVVSDANPLIFLLTATTGTILDATWSHSSGTSVSYQFAGIELQPRNIVVSVYVGPLSTAPADPTATSYNFDDGTIVGLTSDPAWQNSPIEVDVTDTTMLFYTASFSFVEDVYGGTQTVTLLGSPVASINFGNNIQSDNFVDGVSGWQIERDTGDAQFSNVLIRGDSRVQGNVVVDGTLSTNAFIADTIFTNTLRSSNYVAPTLTDNPPNSGYSLEHVEGIGYFELIQGNVTGIVSAPGNTPAAGDFVYNTSAATVEYLDISVDDVLDDFVAVVDGQTHTFKGKLSEPVYELVLPVNIQDNGSNISGNWSGASHIELGAAYTWYSNLSANSILTSPNPNQQYVIGVVWIGYDGDDNPIGELHLNTVGNVEVSANNSDDSLGVLRSVTQNSIIDVVDNIDSFDLNGNYSNVQLSADIPVNAKMHFRLVSRYSDLFSTASSRPTDGSAIAITAGIQLNSAIQFTVTSNDGTTQTITINQLNT